MEAEDTALVRRAADGDTAAAEALVRRHERSVFRLCRTYCRTDEDAMDLAQEALLKAFSSLPGLQEPAAFPAWLGAIARNTCRTALSRRLRDRERARVHLALVGAEPGPPAVSAEDRVLRTEARHLTEEILGAMPDGRPRQCAELFYLGGLEVAEVARRLDTSVSNVTTSLGRARAWLRRHLLVRLTELRGYVT